MPWRFPHPGSWASYVRKEPKRPCETAKTGGGGHGRTHPVHEGALEMAAIVPTTPGLAVTTAKTGMEIPIRSHTFHGRDVYAYTAARLAADIITFAEIGPRLREDIVRIPYQHGAEVAGELYGTIPILDARFGNVWTNLDADLLGEIGLVKGGHLHAEVRRGPDLVYAGRMPLVDSFADVATGLPLAYFNSLGQLALALNQASFAASFGIASGPEWRIRVRRADP